MATVSQLITAEEFGELPIEGPCELVRGQVVEMPPSKALQGWICAQIGFWLRRFLETHDLGRVFSNHTGVITQRRPDTVRGADIAYASYQRLPRGHLDDGFLEQPELIFEVRSPGDRMQKVLEKVAEYLDAGVVAVVVVDASSRTAQIYRDMEPVVPLTAADDIVLDDILPGFRLPVGKCFPE